MGKKPKLTNEQIGEACRLYVEDKLSAVKIAKLFNCSTTTLTGWMKKSGVEIRPKSESISMHWEEFKQEERYLKYIEKLKKSTSSPKSREARANMSKARAEGIASGSIQSRCYGKSGWHKGFYCRSSYEMKFVDMCEEYNIPIESCKITIPYEFEGNTKHYIPDFVSHENKKIFEIKPLKLMSSLMNTAKANAAKKYCEYTGYQYVFITEFTLYNKKMSREDYSVYKS